MKQVVNYIQNNLHKLMIVPAALLFSLFFLYPLCMGIGISLTDWNGLSDTKNFIGFANFFRFFTDGRARSAIGVTLTFGLISPALLNVLGLGLALLFQEEKKTSVIGRMMVYFPSIVSPLIMGYIWTLILAPSTGVLEPALETLNLGFLYHGILGDADHVIWLIIAVNVLQFVGGPMMIYIAGLQSIPNEIIEAAKIDGATYVHTFFRIIWPMLLPSARVNIIMNIIGSLAVFDIIMGLTGGGPGYATESLSIYIYRMAFNGQAGYATAVAIIMFALIAVPVIISLKLLKNEG